MNVIGRCKSIDGQKQKPENGCFTGFLASPARFERAAPRLGVSMSVCSGALWHRMCSLKPLMLWGFWRLSFTHSPMRYHEICSI